MADPTTDLVEALKAELRPEEGFVPTAYHDSRGILTIAYGFNLTRSDADSLLNQLGLSPTAVRSGKWPVTREQGERLLDFTARSALSLARGVVGPEAWDQLPTAAKVVMADMAFNMGGGGLSAFHHMIAAIRLTPPDFAEVERQMNDSQWDRQVPARANELEAIIRALIPTITDEDRAHVASLFVPMHEDAGAHAGEDGADAEEPAA